jgi:short-subunit dehydrogenase
MPPSPNGSSIGPATALVTGASSGIGLAAAQILLREGFNVYGTSRNPDHPALDSGIRWLAFDGSSQVGISQFISENGELLSNLTLLVNNAGSSCFGKASEIPVEIQNAHQTLLLEAPIRLTEAVLGSMKKRGSGTIVNVSSLAALFPLPYMAVYSACKAGLSQYSRDLMLTERGEGITILDFQPGDFRTAFNDNITTYGELDQNQKRAWKRLEENLAKAPGPELAARDILKAIKRGKSGTVRSGSFFQTVVAATGYRLLPGRLLRWAIRKHYALP